LKLLFKDLKCLYADYEDYCSLWHRSEKTPGGWALYYNNPDWVYHASKGGMQLQTWLSEFHSFSEQDFQGWLIQQQVREISGFYQKVLNYNVSLEQGEYVEHALKDGKVEIKKGMINFLVSPTGSGKGYLAEYLTEWSDLPVLCVDPLRRLVQQTFDRLREKRVFAIHYESQLEKTQRKNNSKSDKDGEVLDEKPTIHPSVLFDCKALCICTPSVRKEKRILEYFLNRRNKTKVNLLMDEAHLLAKQLFDDKQLYPRFLDCLQGNVETIVLMTATPNRNTELLIERLEKDFT
jgi:hypothetical protein